MREIKFRGLRLYTRDFVYGNLVLLPESTLIVVHKDGGKPRDVEWLRIDPETVGQLRYVKNGIEYYDGDVYYHAGYGNEVVSDLCELQAALLEGKADDIGDIIGNVYENPELLED